MKEQILDAAEGLVQERGFDAVTFQEIADAVGLRKPSLFHHVKNKEALAAALIDRCVTKHGPQYAAVVDRRISADRKLREIAKIFEDGLENNRPCLLAAIGGSRQSLTPANQNQLEEAATLAIGRFAEIFVEGRKETSLVFKGKPEHAAMSFFAMLQGLQTLCQAKGETEAYSKAAATYIDSLTAKK